MANLRLASALFLVLGACATPAPEFSAYPDLHEAMSEFQNEQARFNGMTTLPQKFDFPGQGQVTVRHLSLDGYPGNTYLRCRWHYQNSTGRPVVRALVSLDVLDGQGHMVASQVSVCLFPSPRAIYEGTFLSDELRTQTRGAHLQPGWGWRITCKAEYEDEADVATEREAEARRAAEQQAELQRVETPIIRRE